VVAADVRVMGDTAREEGVNGLGPLYQFTLNTRLR
jgi:hypothetical protein